jgi:hypothetical protein
LEIYEPLIQYFKYKKEIIDINEINKKKKTEIINDTEELNEKCGSTYIPKVICFASVLPFYKELSNILDIIYRLYSGNSNNSVLPIEKLIEHAKENMRPENIINEGFAGQVYTFKYDECGRDDNKITDFFEVVVFPDTKDIITMYPTFTPNNRYYIDLNHLKEKKEDSSFGVKRLSQIEKFNKRYGTNE